MPSPVHGAIPLRPCACDPVGSRGRRIREPPAPWRDDYQRDRDRIVHSTAFRRLVYKTQVFLNHEGDLFRTRLTHSLEVAQLARAIARPLGLNETLCEAIALAHDLGHTPFGHAGQEALDACLREVDSHGAGFEHNFQSLRVVDVLEQRYPAFDGLNLTFETREGILKHCSLHHARALEVAEPGGVGRRFIERTRPSLEAQICNVADEIAYSAHDIDDGVRSGLVTMQQLLEVPTLREVHDAVRAEHSAANGRRMLFEVIRRTLSKQVHDLVDASARRLDAAVPATPDDARRLPPMILFGEDVAREVREIKAFLRLNLYRHPRVVATTDVGRKVIRDLFHAYVDRPNEMPQEHAVREPRPAAVVDYVAGMTDRFALREHERLHGPGVTAALRHVLDGGTGVAPAD